MKMIAHATRGMPWIPWLPVTALVGLIAWSVGQFPADFASRHLYTRAGIVVASLGLAFVFDDPAAETTDPSPSPLRLRRAIRAAMGLLVWSILVAWLLIASSQGMNPVLITTPEHGHEMPIGRLLLEGSTLALSGLAVAAVVAKRWDDEPGKIASAALLALYAASWTVPEHWKPWALPNDPRWETSYPWWWAAVGLAISITAVTSWDSHRGRDARILKVGRRNAQPLLAERDPTARSHS